MPEALTSNYTEHGIALLTAQLEKMIAEDPDFLPRIARMQAYLKDEPLGAKALKKPARSRIAPRANPLQDAPTPVKNPTKRAVKPKPVVKSRFDLIDED